VLGEEPGEQQAQPVRGGRRGGRVRVLRLVPAQVVRQRAAAYRVPERRDRIGEEAAALAARQIALEAPGKPVPSRPPAGSAEHNQILGNATDKHPARPTFLVVVVTIRAAAVGHAVLGKHKER
jgi:hypothetical protein